MQNPQKKHKFFFAVRKIKNFPQPQKIRRIFWELEIAKQFLKFSKKQ